MLIHGILVCIWQIGVLIIFHSFLVCTSSTTQNLNPKTATQSQSQNLSDFAFPNPPPPDAPAPEVFTRYTDSAFPSTSAVDESLRFSLRYEVGAFYRHLRELEKAVEEKSLPGGGVGWGLGLGVGWGLGLGELVVE